jgi:hypothetical protein
VFIYSGPSIEAVQDKLPTAKVTQNENGSYTVRAETSGKGIRMWLLSQGSMAILLFWATLHCERRLSDSDKQSRRDAPAMRKCLSGI